jgi:hypothetical protein
LNGDSFCIGSGDGDIQDCIDHLIVAENAERLKESEL